MSYRLIQCIGIYLFLQGYVVVKTAIMLGHVDTLFDKNYVRAFYTLI